MIIGAEVALNAGQLSDALQQAQSTVALAEQYDNLFIVGLGHRIWAQALPKDDEEIPAHLRASLTAFEQGGAQIEATRSRRLIDNRRFPE
jgi:hypothetical protein